MTLVERNGSASLTEQVRFFFSHLLPQRPGYEERPEQLEMALAVARALEQEELLLVEAGTGTGKSLAYLIPSLLWSLQIQQPVVISTRTLNLQQQLLEQDIPLLRSLCPESFRVTPARGWSNYVCLRRLQAATTVELPNRELEHEASLLADELAAGTPGIRQQLRVSEALWPHVQADSTACSRQQCAYYGDCYLFKERREMERSELIVANHSLVLADLALRQDGAPGVLPKPAAWILDEGHHLEEIANDHLGRAVSLARLQRLRQSVYDPKGKSQDSGWLPVLRARLVQTPVSAELRSELLEPLDQRLLAALPSFYQQGEDFFHWLGEAIQATRGEGRIPIGPDFFESELGQQCRLSSSYWAAAAEALSAAAKGLLHKLNDNELETQSGGQAELRAFSDRLIGLRDDLEFCLFPESQDWVFWAQRGAQDVELGATPLDVGERLARHFFQPARSAVVTSATLALHDKMDFYRERVGLQDDARVQELCLESPFDYPNRCYLGVATDLPTPDGREFWQRVQPALSWLVQQLGGRTFLLATSYASLQQARAWLKEPLEQHGIALLVQGDAPASQLLADFRRNPRALLIGADSFWEGVDVPGDDLSCVVLARLPFRVPSDPLVQAHCRRIDEGGGNSFGDYQIPQAILRFRQGFGRLIRSHRDRGLVLVLDSRLYHKRYGNEFLSSLPRCRRRAGKLNGLVQDAFRWLTEPEPAGPV